MKKTTLILGLLLIFNFIAFSQGTLICKIKILNKNEMPISGFELVFKEKSQNLVIKKITDADGVVNVEFDKGEIWTLNFKDVKNYHTFRVPSSATKRSFFSFVYDPMYFKFKNREVADRTNVNIQEINQEYIQEIKPVKNMGFVIITLITPENKVVKNTAVALFNLKQKTKYLNKTNSQGKAFFIVPYGFSYEVDVKNLECYDKVSMLNKKYSIVSAKVSYKPTEINEQLVNDTFIQNIANNKFKPTSERALLTVRVFDFENGALNNEEVVLEMIDSEKCYKAITNIKGETKFLLPINSKYLVHFKYERSVGVIDLNDVIGFKTISVRYNYRGSNEIEDFYQSTERDKDGFITKFMTTPIIKAKPLDYDYLEKTDIGYNICFKSKTQTSTPLVVDDNFYMHNGYLERGFYCFDMNDGSYEWGVELAESGVSTAVCDEDIILLNTYSCTLYAINAKTGELIWSKWLGPILYHTPSVKNGKVYAVYPNNLDFLNDKSKGEFVLVCFDLQNGNIIWQNWLNAEVLSAPVVTEKNVYLTTLSGSLYLFDNSNGEKINSLNCNATTPPTVVNDRVFVTQKVKGKFDYEENVVYSAKDLSYIQAFSNLRGKVKTEIYFLSNADKMNHSGSRMLHFKNKNYNVIDSRLICSNPNNGAIIWSAELSKKPEDNASMPVIVNDRLIIGSIDGYVRIFNAENGKKLSEFNTGEQICIQPAVNNGIISCGTKNGKIVTIDTKDKSLTGWNQWCIDGGHNTVVD